MTIDTAKADRLQTTGPRRRAQLIREGLVALDETLRLLKEAWDQQDSRALGYPDWHAYVRAEFDPKG